MTLQIHYPARVLWIPCFIIVVIVIAGVFSGEFNRTNSLDDDWAQAQRSCCIISRFLLEAKFWVPLKHGGNNNIIHPFAALMMGKTHACIAWHWAQTCLNVSYLDGLTKILLFFVLAAVVLQIVTGFRWVLGTYHVAMNELFSSYGSFVAHKPFLPMMYVFLPSSTLLPILFFSAHSSNQSLAFCWASFVSKFFGSQIYFCNSSRKLEE